MGKEGKTVESVVAQFKTRGFDKDPAGADNDLVYIRDKFYPAKWTDQELQDICDQMGWEWKAGVDPMYRAIRILFKLGIQAGLPKQTIDDGK